jgi:nucleotide-binding universal stress UspA family protein
MKKILIAVDETRSTKNIFSKCINICKCINPKLIILLYVERYEGRSLITDMLTEYKEALDRKANTILSFYKNALEEKPPVPSVETIVKIGHPADEILNTAKEKEVDMILIGSAGKRVSHIFMGSVSREVVNRAEIPVLVVK